MLGKPGVWIVVHIVFYLFSTGFVTLRLFDRYRRNVFRHTDIATMVAFFFSNVYFCIAMFVAHATQDASDTKKNTALSFWLFGLAYVSVIPVTKMSSIFLLLELEPWKWHRRLLKALLVYTIAHMILFLISTFVACIPVTSEYSWSIVTGGPKAFAAENKGHKCLVLTNIIIVNFISNSLSEVIMMGLALQFVYNMGAGFTRKLGLVLAFMLGFMTVAATVIAGLRIVTGYVLIQQEPTFEINHYYFVGGIWSAVEVHFSLALASALPLRAMILRFVSAKLAALGLTSVDGTTSNPENNYSDKLRWPGRKTRWPDLNLPLRRASGRTDGSSVTLERVSGFRKMFRKKRAEEAHLADLENPAVVAQTSQRYVSFSGYDLDQTVEQNREEQELEQIKPAIDVDVTRRSSLYLDTM